MESDIDYSALDLNSPVLRYEMLRTRQLLNTPQSILREDQLRGGHTTTSFNNAEVRDATRVRLFCEKNSFEFVGNISSFPDPDSAFANTSSVFGPFRRILYSAIIKDPFGGWLEIGQLRYNTASYYNDNKDIRVMYAKRVLDFSLPRFCINSFTSPITPHDTANLETYKTESSEFSKLFNLHVEKGRAQEVLAILTPDVMAVLIDKFSHLDIDVHGTTLFCMGIGEQLSAESFQTVSRAVDNLAYCLRPRVRHHTAAIPATVDEYRTVYGYARPVNAKSSSTIGRDLLLSLGIALCLIAFCTMLLWLVL